jgi:phenylpropionate dioxygenase-like ring-hydroxylating dioxygenase large terminal subunit
MSEPSDSRSPNRRRAPDRSWYLVARSNEIARDRVTAFSVAGRELVAFRDDDARPRAFAPHCPHMGAHLRHATARNGVIRCALHHLCFDGDGACRAAERAGGDLSLESYAVDERYGAVFVSFSDRPSSSLDEVFGNRLGGSRYSCSRPFEVRCAWEAVVANAFDIRHLRTVHNRRLVGGPGLTRPAPAELSLAYRSRVAGNGLADRVLRRIAPDGIDVEITCHGGTLISVASRAGRHAAQLVVALTPREETTSVVLFVSAPSGRGRALEPLRRVVAAKLYESFLARDLRVLDGMRFAPRLLPEETVLAALLEYLGSLARGDAEARLRVVPHSSAK